MVIKHKKFILGLPRSRTAWLGAYFGFVHEGLWYYPDYKDFMRSHHVGDSTTCYHLIKEYVADAVVIHRSTGEIIDSIRSIGLVPPCTIEQRAEELRVLPGLHIKYEDIDQEIKTLHQYLDIPFNEKLYKFMKNTQIQNYTLINIMRRELCL